MKDQYVSIKMKARQQGCRASGNAALRFLHYFIIQE
jgi:hypothetical protein